MAAFSDTAFDTSAFSVGAFDFGSGPTPPPDVVIVDQPVVGGGPARSRLSLREGRTPEEVRRDRERYGILPPAVEEVVIAVAVRQAEALVTDEQKQFEELTRELKLRELEYDARYLEAMNVERQRLITAEISSLLKRRNDEGILLMLMMAAVVA